MKHEELLVALTPSIEEIAALNALKNAVDATEQVSYLEVKDLLKTVIELQHNNQRLTDAMNVVLEEMTLRNA